jgi:hypothetical protein
MQSQHCEFLNKATHTLMISEQCDPNIVNVLTGTTPQHCRFLNIATQTLWISKSALRNAFMNTTCLYNFRQDMKIFML